MKKKKKKKIYIYADEYIYIYKTLKFTDFINIPCNTRLSDDGDNLVIARTGNNWGDRCLAAAGPKLWKDLPQTIEDHS